MIFQDRKEAGQRLSSLLSTYKGQQNTIVLGLARGGIVVAYEIAKALALPLNVLVPRKIGAPGNPELAIGAVAEDGELWINPDMVGLVGASPTFIHQGVDREKKIAQERLTRYRMRNPLEELKGKTVILVDDGIATGATLFVEIQSLRKKNVSSIVVASPIASKRAWNTIQGIVEDGVCLNVQEHFFGISSFYHDFSQVEDETVLALLQKQVS